MNEGNEVVLLFHLFPSQCNAETPFSSAVIFDHSTWQGFCPLVDDTSGQNRAPGGRTTAQQSGRAIKPCAAGKQSGQAMAPASKGQHPRNIFPRSGAGPVLTWPTNVQDRDRKSTRLNSSHTV